MDIRQLPRRGALLVLYALTAMLVLLGLTLIGTGAGIPLLPFVVMLGIPLLLMISALRRHHDG